MRRCKIGVRISAALLSCLLVLTNLPYTVYASENAEKAAVHIQSIGDFLKFEQDCRVADYSKGRKVYLEKDLDLSNVYEDKNNFGITSFSGYFYGQNHKITGLNISQGSESVGLFQYVEADALICDLILEGNIECSVSRNKVGSVAGINAGSIRNCHFNGRITGVGVTGGIAGLNGTGGYVLNCTNNGIMDGVHSIGGIVGQNRGIISECTNYASVNGGTDWIDLEGDTKLSPSFSGLLGVIREEVQDGTDFGGIAGWSNGIIAGCENKGTVGYQHTGKNVGGIVGRQSGVVISCKNNGKVYGKQDVGGIVGQFEPYTEYEDVDELDTKVKELHDLMNKMIDDMESMGDDLHEDFRELNEETEGAIDTSDALMDEMRDVIKKNVEVINELSKRIDYAMNHFETVMAYLNQAISIANTVMDDMDKVRKDLNVSDRLTEDGYDPAKDKRLVLMAGQGGYMKADNVNPAEGVAVTITITPEKGYKLSKLTMKPYGGQGTDVTASVVDDKYVISSMPAANVTVSAVFEYVGGQYLVQTNAGGKATLSSDGTSLRLEPEDGYKVASVTIDGGADIYSGSGDNVTLPMAAEGSEHRILVTFEKVAGTYRVNIVTGTGGNVSADPSMAAPGETVTLSFTTLSNYELDTTAFTIKDGNGATVTYSTGIDYTFTMPANDVFVEAAFKYNVSSDTKIYAVSNVGGTVSMITNPATSNTNVMMNCKDGYVVEKMIVTDSALPASNSYTINAADMNKNDATGVYSYELATSTMTAPIQIRVVFQKDTTAFYDVHTISGTGGTIVADKHSVKADDKLIIAVTNEPHYRLAKLTIDGGANLAAQVSDGTYEYTIPAGIASDVEIVAEYEPVLLVMQSKMVGGVATYAIQGQDVVFTILPDTGYKLGSFTVKDHAGAVIACQKQYADSDIYKFGCSALDGKTGYLDIAYSSMNNKDTVDNAKDDMTKQTENVVDGVNNISDVSDKIKDLLTDEYGEPKNPEDLTSDELEEFNKLMLDLLGYVSDTGVAAGGVLGDADTVIRVVGPYVDEAWEETDKDLDKLSKDAKNMNNSLQAAGKELQNIMNYLNALDNLQVQNLSKNFDKNSDKLKIQLDTISDLLGRLDDDAYKHSETLEEDMRAVNDKMNEVLTLLVDKLNNMEGIVNGEDVIEDCSAENPDDSEASKVTNCSNMGSVNGDRNVGGIAGNMSVEKNDEKVSVGRKYLAKEVLIGCSNLGFVTVKTENGGGITGNLQVGYVAECTAYGRIRSTAGKYLGGIVGIGKGTIESCNAAAVLSGSEYIGGIAGQAEIARNCYAMPTILQADGWVGAVMGYDNTEGDEDTDITLERGALSDRISGNYYVSGKLYGINGISYVGIAEPITYAQLVEMTKARGDFTKLTVTFIDENEEILSTEEVSFGMNIREIAYPDVKTEIGDYMEWDGYDGETIRGNLILQAVTTANVTILSGEKGTLGKPIALAEGVFTEAAEIAIEDYHGELPLDVPVGAICHAYHIALLHTDLDLDSVTRIRLYNQEGGKATVYRVDDGKWVKLSSRQLGSYEEVEMLGTQGVFCIASVEKESHLLIILLVTGLALVILALILVIVKLRKSGKKPVKE